MRPLNPVLAPETFTPTAAPDLADVADVALAAAATVAVAEDWSELLKLDALEAAEEAAEDKEDLALLAELDAELAADEPRDDVADAADVAAAVTAATPSVGIDALGSTSQPPAVDAGQLTGVTLGVYAADDVLYSGMTVFQTASRLEESGVTGVGVPLRE